MNFLSSLLFKILMDLVTENVQNNKGDHKFVCGDHLFVHN